MVRFTVPIADILGNAYYRYEMTSSNYNPTIDSTITITVVVKSVFGNPVENKSLTLYDNGSSVGSATTNSSGVATWTVTFNNWDNHHFTCNTATLDIMANGYKSIWSNATTNPTIRLYRNKNNARLYLNAHKTNFTTTWVQYGSSAFMSSVAPMQAVVRLNNDATVLFSISNTGTLQWKSNTGATLNNKTVYAQIDWSIA